MRFIINHKKSTFISATIEENGLPSVEIVSKMMGKAQTFGVLVLLVCNTIGQGSSEYQPGRFGICKDQLLFLQVFPARDKLFNL